MSDLHRDPESQPASAAARGSAEAGNQPYDVRVNLSPEPQSLSPLRQLLLGLAEEVGLETARFSDLELAASEAFGNALRHGECGPEDRVGIHVRVEPEAWEVCLEYPGEPFEVGPPHLPEAERTSGRGRFLMELLADDVQYEFADGVTRVTLRKRW